MIYSFSFKNFCSFYDKMTLSFEDIRKGVETDCNMFVDTPLGVRLSKVMILIGHNASGKTNALKVLAFLRWFVVHSFQDLEEEKAGIPIDSFVFSDNQDSISEFELVFEHKKQVYRYLLHLCKTHVVKEELYKKENTQFFSYLFKRIWNPETGKSDISQQMDLKTEVLKEILRKNVTLISTAAAIKDEFLLDISGYFRSIMTNVWRTGKHWDTSSVGDQLLSGATKNYRRNEDRLRKAEAFLKNFDLGLEGVTIEEGKTQAKTGETEVILVPYGLHRVNEKIYRLAMSFESSGTKNMFVLLSLLLPVIEKGGIAVIDELEIDLHPHVIPQIINLFADPTINCKNSQLLFTSHSLEILNHLEKEQIVLVEKQKDCKSVLYRLDEVKGVRRDDNYFAKYMAGAYGAVPNI